MDPNQITETLKSSFLFAFRTGNIVVDTLLTGIIIMLSTHLLSLANSMFAWDYTTLVTRLWAKQTAKIVITGKYKYRGKRIDFFLQPFAQKMLLGVIGSIGKFSFCLFNPKDWIQIGNT